MANVIKYHPKVVAMQQFQNENVLRRSLRERKSQIEFQLNACLKRIFFIQFLRLCIRVYDLCMCV